MSINFSIRNILTLIVLVVVNLVVWEFLEQIKPLLPVGFVATCLSTMYLMEAFLTPVSHSPDNLNEQ